MPASCVASEEAWQIGMHFGLIYLAASSPGAFSTPLGSISGPSIVIKEQSNTNNPAHFDHEEIDPTTPADEP